MSESIFRKKSLDRIKSPENLNDYVRVCNPGIWLVMAAVIALLLGVCVWGVFGSIETKVHAEAYVENGEAVLMVSGSDAVRMQTGEPAVIGGAEGVVLEIGAPNEAGLCRVTVKTDVEDGLYEAEIVTESIHPMSFVLN